MDFDRFTIALFPAVTLVVQPGAGHFPWLDDPDFFRAAVTAFMACAPQRESPSRGRDNAPRPARR